MTVIYLTENNTKCYGVKFHNNGYVKVQNFEVISNHKNNMYCVKPLEIFFGKSQICDMTAMSGAFDKSVYDGNTILIKVNEDCNRHTYVYFGGNMVCSFMTNDKIYDYISNMGNNLIPYSIAIGDENIYFLTPHFIFFRRDKIDYDVFLSRNENFVDPYHYHVSNCGKDSFKNLRLYKIHSNYN